MQRKLPVFMIAKTAVLLPFQKGLFALRIGWPVILLLSLPAFAVDLGFLEPSVQAGDESVQEVWTIEGPAGPFVGIAAALFYLFLLSVIAVFWHRNILLQETAAPAVPLRADALQLRYIGYALLVLLLWVLFFFGGGGVAGFLFVFLVGGTDPARHEVAHIIGLFMLFLPFVLLLLVVLFRISLVLPAAAIGHQGFGIRSAWRASRGSSWRILGIQLLVMLFILALSAPPLLIAFFLGGPELFMKGIDGVPRGVVAAGKAFVDLLFTLMSIGLLSLTYAYLIHVKPKEDARMEA